MTNHEQTPQHKQSLVKLEYPSQLGCLFGLIPLVALGILLYKYDYYILSLLCLILIFRFIDEAYKSSTKRKHYHQWLDENNNRIIFFFPTKKPTQILIKEKIGSKINADIRQIYYDSAQLTGPINNELFMKFGLSALNRKYPNFPRLLQISNNQLIELMNLYELNRIERLDQERIDEIILEINNYF